MFGTKHIILIAACVAVGVLLCVFLRKTELKKWFRLLMYVGIVSETIKVFYYILSNEATYGGYLPKTDLPFHLCSIQLIFIALLNFTKSEKLHRTLMAFMIPSCLVGGAAAILIPTSSALGSPVISFQYFTYHTVIVAFAVCLLLKSKEIGWMVKDYSAALKMLAFMGFIAIYINSLAYDVVEYSVVDGVKNVSFVNRVNFMYVVDPPVSGLPFLNKDHGWLVYFMHLAATGVIAVTLCFIKPIIKAIASGKKPAEVPEA
ncbi:MAG: YwaF family protein [Clostridiales bacterium]|nr:YwaF family protein [Clostridiales bacterium]